MKKYLIYLGLFITLILPTYAANMEVVCDNNVDGDQCNIVSGNTLFNESNWYPGSTVIKTIKITNNDKNDDCRLKMYTAGETQTPSNFGQHIFTTIISGTDTLYGTLNNTDAANTNNLQNVFDADNISLGSISQNGGTKEYSWYVTFDPDASNDFQGANLSFDFKLQFKCDHDESNNSDSNNEEEQNNTSGEVQGTQTGGLLSFLGSVLGDNNEETTNEGTETQQPEVQGTATEVTSTQTTCKDHPLWGFLFIGQFILLLFISAVFKDKKIIKNILKLITAGVFIYVFANYVCVTWDVFVSIIISILALFL